MKPCPDKKEAIALLAMNALGPSETAALRGHLQQCPACDAYATRLATTCAQLGEPVASSAATELPPGFHARLKHRIQSEHQAPSLASTFEALRDLFTPARVVSTAAALVLVVGLAFWGRTGKQSPAPPVAQVGEPVGNPRSFTGADLPAASTLMAYQAAFNRSFEDFDALITQNAARTSTGEGMTLMRSGTSSF